MSPDAVALLFLVGMWLLVAALADAVLAWIANVDHEETDR